MDEKRPQYRMNKLMNYPELDALAAQRKAGSSEKYFELLAQFTEAAPVILTDLTSEMGAENLMPFLKKIHTLQKYLLAVGSAPLVWLAEKTANLVQAGNWTKCEDDLYILCSRVKTLCAQLDEAKADPSALSASMASGKAAPGVPAPPEKEGVRPIAAMTPEPFEKLNILIENFELDDALAMIRSLLAFTYGGQIDTLLANICQDLVCFNHSGAAAQSKRLLQIFRETLAGSAKADKKKILAIDDVPDVLNAVKAVLKEEYAIYGVTNHMSALKFLTSNSADLILLDIEMPDMNGFALLGIIRKIKAYEKTPVLFLTGNVNVENIKKAHSAGANDFIKKPVDAEVLLAKVSKHLGEA